MRLNRRTVEDLVVGFEPVDYLRVLNAAFRATPLGMGYGNTRFSSPARAFKLLYIGQDVATGVAETVVRDRFEGHVDRILDVSEFDTWAITCVTARQPLFLVDLRKNGLLRLGVSTDAARAKSHSEGQALSEAMHAQFDVDGFLYVSRLTGENCAAVYERAVLNKLTATPAILLFQHPELIAALQSLSIVVRKEE